MISWKIFSNPEFEPKVDQHTLESVSWNDPELQRSKTISLPLIGQASQPRESLTDTRHACVSHFIQNLELFRPTLTAGSAADTPCVAQRLILFTNIKTVGTKIQVTREEALAFRDQFNM
jgi:hypothetical protein